MWTCLERPKCIRCKCCILCLSFVRQVDIPRDSRWPSFLGDHHHGRCPRTWAGASTFQTMTDDPFQTKATSLGSLQQKQRRWDKRVCTNMTGFGWLLVLSVGKQVCTRKQCFFNAWIEKVVFPSSRWTLISGKKVRKPLDYWSSGLAWRLIFTQTWFST